MDRQRCPGLSLSPLIRILLGFIRISEDLIKILLGFIKVYQDLLGFIKGERRTDRQRCPGLSLSPLVKILIGFIRILLGGREGRIGSGAQDSLSPLLLGFY